MSASIGSTQMTSYISDSSELYFPIIRLNESVDSYLDFSNQSSPFATLLLVSRRDPQLYPWEYRVIATILHAVIFLLGFWGNVLLLIVVRRTKSLRVPTYCYLVRIFWTDT